MEARIARGEPLASRDEWMAERPEVWQDAAPYWAAFQLLRDHRPVSASGMGAPILGSIALADVRSYLDEVGVTDRTIRWRYLMLLTALDREDRTLTSEHFSKLVKKTEGKGPGLKAEN